MSRPSTLVSPCCSLCRHTPATPCRHLVDCVARGPICHESEDCATLRRQRLEIARRGGEGVIFFVGAGTCGLANGAREVVERIQAFVRERELDAKIVEVGCSGYCQREVFVDVLLGAGPKLSYCDLGPDTIDELLLALFDRDELDNRFLYGRFEGEAAGRMAELPKVWEQPYFRTQTKVVLANCGHVDPGSLDSALAAGAFQAAARVLHTRTPAEVCDHVLAAGLRGRGGAGFPTGRKWRMAHDAVSAEKYVICNADEGDPGAFMDRAILEGDPFRVVEGLLLAGYAIGASSGYIYCRAEYPLAIARLDDAIEQCRAAGLLGTNILDSLFSFDLKVKQGAGAFVCGEETAIIASIEGGRGMPRPRPPYPATCGLHRKPTILNNVETLANVPGVLAHEPEWFQSLGQGSNAGTKVFALSGSVRNTGLVEVPVGVSLRSIVEDIGGGALEGHRIKAVQIGGPSGGCIPADHLDVSVDYESLKELGAMMGSGGMVVMDETCCMVDVAHFFMGFIRSESCGKCTPCREGTTRMFEILEAITQRPLGDENKRLERMQGTLLLEELAETVQECSLCGLGQSAPNPVLSTLRYFRDEYEAHILEQRCPVNVCVGLRRYTIDPAACIGCMLCMKKCPAGAIIGKRKHPHYIVEDRCTGCGVCVEACRHDAVSLAS